MMASFDEETMIELVECLIKDSKELQLAQIDWGKDISLLKFQQLSPICKLYYTLYIA